MYWSILGITDVGTGLRTLLIILEPSFWLLFVIWYKVRSVLPNCQLYYFTYDLSTIGILSAIVDYLVKRASILRCFSAISSSCLILKSFSLNSNFSFSRVCLKVGFLIFDFEIAFCFSFSSYSCNSIWLYFRIASKSSADMSSMLVAPPVL